MSRTTTDRVKGVLQRDYDAARSPDLTEYMVTAEHLVDRIVLKAEGDGEAVSDPLLATIETWLAAWAYCQFDQPYSEKTTEKAKGVFQGRTGMYFESNKYGQTALTLDPTGTLATVNEKEKKHRVQVLWLGTPGNLKRSYEERNGC